METLPLHIAIEAHDEEEIVRLLGKGANPNEESYCGMYALEHAIFENLTLRTIESLLEHGAAIEETPYTPALIVAAEGRNNAAIKLLLEAGADPNVVEAEEEEGTALTLSAFLGNTEGTDILLQFGANPQKTNRAGETPLEIAQQERHSEVISLLKAAMLRS